FAILKALSGFTSGASFDGLQGGFLISYLFTYDLIYNSGVMSSTDKTSLENRFKSLVPLSQGQKTYETQINNWLNIQGLREFYIAPEWQVPFFYETMVGYLLEDPTLISWGVDGNGYPMQFDDHATVPTDTQNPFSVKHFIHDGFAPNGSSYHMFGREGTFQYYFSKIYALEFVA